MYITFSTVSVSVASIPLKATSLILRQAYAPVDNERQAGILCGILQYPVSFSSYAYYTDSGGVFFLLCCSGLSKCIHESIIRWISACRIMLWSGYGVPC